MFVVVKDGLYWVGGGWCNSVQHAFRFSRRAVAEGIAKIVDGRVAEVTAL